MLGRRGFLKAIGVGVLGMSLALKSPQTASSIGTSIRFVKFWNPVNSKMVGRFDVFIGLPVQMPKHAEIARAWTLDEWNRMGARFPRNAEVSVWHV